MNRSQAIGRIDGLEERTLLSATTTTLVASPANPTYGQTDRLTATVSSQAGTPNAGSVTFFDNTTALGTIPVSNGFAQLATTTLSAGLHVVTATYSGDGANFDASTTVVGPSSIIQTVAGTGVGGYSGDGGPATSAQVSSQPTIAVDAAGNLFIADVNNNVIREVNASTGIITTVAGNGTEGFSGDGGAATSAELDSPSDVAVDAHGNIFIADSGNNRVREVSSTTGLISTYAGAGEKTGNGVGDGGPAAAASINLPVSVAVDAAGNVYIAESVLIREVNAATGVISTVAGDGNSFYNGDDIPATSAGLDDPRGLAVDAAGNIYFADFGSNRVREVNASTGLISTIAGTGDKGYNGDGIAATSAELSEPFGVAVDAAGDVFIADYFPNNRVREVLANTGTILTVAGNGNPGYNGDGIAAASAELIDPTSLAVDAAGNLFIADRNRIREVASGAASVAVTPATPTVVTSDAGGLYSGNPFPATATATGVDGVTAVSGSITFAYYVGSTVSNNGPSTPPSDPGTYTVVATFTGSDPNYANAQSAPVTFTIDPGDLLVPTVTASDTSGDYNGQAFAATAGVTGQGGVSVDGTFSFTYYPGSTVSGAGSSIAPTDAGTYSVVAQFTSADPNYTDAESSPVIFTVGQVAPVASIGDASAPYTGAPFAATATAIGVDGVTPVSGSFAFTYYDGTSASGTGTSIAPTNVGTYTVVASFTSSDPNYIDAQTDPVTFSISQLTPNLVVSDAGGIFSGSPFPASVSVTGSNNQPLSLSLAGNYSTFLGGSGTDIAANVATDSSGNTFVTGYTFSTDFPTTPGVYQTTAPSDDGSAAFVAKFDPNGNLLWSTYIGGSLGIAIAVDSSDNVYIGGEAGQSNFTATSGAFQTSTVSDATGFVAKLSSDGTTLIWGTYLGGSNTDEVTALTLDGAGNVYVAGFTTSTDFPTHNALQPFNPGGYAGFASELNNAGSALVFSTYGGGGDTFPSGIAVDPAGNIYVNGSTDFSSFPTTPGAFQRTFSGNNDAFVLKLGPSGTSLIYSTFLGDSGYTASSDFGMAVDAAGDAFVTGFTDSPDFPMVNAFQSAFSGSQDAYVVELNPSGSAIVGSTYFGGSSTAGGSSITLDSQGNVYIAGLTDSPDLPLVNPVSTSGDFYVAEFNLSNGTLIDSTYLGGTNDQGFVTPIVVDNTGNLVVVGETSSSSFPTTANAFQPNYGGGPYDAFVYGLTTGVTLTYYAGTNASGTPLAGAPSAVGTYTVVATFTSNDPNISSAESDPVTFTIGSTGPLTPTVTALESGGVYNGEPFAATAAASFNAVTVSGSFAFTYYVGNAASGTGSSSAPIDAGTYTVVADFTSSDPNFTDAESAPVTFTITPADTTTTVGTTAGTVAFGQSETLTATVASLSVTANVGTVTFFDGTTPLGTVPVSNGTATLTTTTLPAGLNVISATYSGDGLDILGSSSALGPSSIIQTVAGTGDFGYTGDGGPATSARLFFPSDVVEDAAGDLFIADSQNNVVRKVDATTHIITTVAGTGTAGYSGDGSAATSAELNFPTEVALDAAGNLFIADVRNDAIREVSASTGLITTVAGNGTAGYNGDGVAATSAELNLPTSVAVDAAGNLYIADYGNNLVREVSAATGLISSIAGTGIAGYNGDSISASSAELNQPDDVAFDAAGNLFIAEDAGNRVREVNAATGLISTIAGTGDSGYNGDSIPATSAQLDEPEGVAVDAAGNVFITDSRNNRIREVNVTTGLISTIAGTGDSGYNGDGIPAGSAQLGEPSDLVLDTAGDVFFAEINSRVREIVTGNAVVRVTAAQPSVVAIDAGGIYNANTFPATATVTGVGGSAVSGSFSFEYYVGSTVSGTGSAIAPTNAGTYTVVAAFTSSDTNYTDAQSAPLTFSIGQATPLVVASDAGGTYNANPFPATATATGVGGASVGGTFAFTYYVGSTVHDSGSPIAPSNAGTYTVVATFNSGNSNYTDAQSAPVTFTIVNPPPTIGAPASANVTENASLIFSTANGNVISVADAVAGSTDSLSLHVAHGSLTLASTSGLTFTTGSNGSGTFTVRGSIADLTTALDGLTYRPTALYIGSDSLSVSIVDPGTTLSASASVALTITIAPPAITAPATASLAENGSLAFSTSNGNAISFTDVNAGTGKTESLTLFVTHGTLTLGSTAGLTFKSGKNNSASLTATGTAANLNLALSGLTYKPTAAYFGTDSLAITVANSVDSQSASTNVVLTVNALSPPTITAPATAAVGENLSVTFSTLNGNAISVADANAGTTADTLTLSVTNGTLTLGSTPGLTFKSGKNGTASFSVAGTLANLNTALNGLIYKPTTSYAGPDTLSLAILNTVDGQSASGSIALTVNPASSPVISGPATASFNENSSQVFSAANGNAISFTDASAGTSKTESLTLSAAHGTLKLATTFGLTVLSGAKNSAAMTVTGTVTNLNAALNGLTYKPATGYSGADSLAASVSDPGDGLSASLNVALTINVLAPTITATATASVAQNGSLVFSSTNGNLISTTDVNAGTAMQRLTLTATNGTLKLGTLSGITFVSGANKQSAMTITGTLTSLNNALKNLTFTPTSGFVGPASISLTYTDVGNGLSATANIAVTVGNAGAVSPPTRVPPFRFTASEPQTSSSTSVLSPSTSTSAIGSDSPTDDSQTQWSGFAAALDYLNS